VFDLWESILNGWCQDGWSCSRWEAASACTPLDKGEIDPVSVFMEIVVRMFVLNKKIGENTESDTYSQAYDVDQGVAFEFYYISPGDFNVIEYHDTLQSIKPISGKKCCMEIPGKKKFIFFSVSSVLDFSSHPT
jgi:hypothetical protein